MQLGSPLSHRFYVTPRYYNSNLVFTVHRILFLILFPSRSTSGANVAAAFFLNRRTRLRNHFRASLRSKSHRVPNYRSTTAWIVRRHGCRGLPCSLYRNVYIKLSSYFYASRTPERAKQSRSNLDIARFRERGARERECRKNARDPERSAARKHFASDESKSLKSLQREKKRRRGRRRRRRRSRGGREKMNKEKEKKDTLERQCKPVLITNRL